MISGQLEYCGKNLSSIPTVEYLCGPEMMKIDDDINLEKKLSRK
jgi:hypothetical protein